MSAASLAIGLELTRGHVLGYFDDPWNIVAAVLVVGGAGFLLKEGLMFLWGLVTAPSKRAAE